MQGCVGPWHACAPDSACWGRGPAPEWVGGADEVAVHRLQFSPDLARVAGGVALTSVMPGP